VRPARWPAGRPRTAAALGSALAGALVLSGCVSLPTAQTPGGLSSQNSAQGSDVRIWPQPPAAGIDPRDIVEGFLQAAAATVSEPPGGGQPLSIAQSYLTGEASKEWDSGEVSVFSSLNSVSLLPDSTNGQGCYGLTGCFGFTGNLVGQIDDEGTYVVAPADQPSSTIGGVTQSGSPYPFHLTENAKHVYQIDHLPLGLGAALTQEDFAASYSNYNLYYLNDAQPTKSLIPVPLYLRSSVSDQMQATTLANDLFANELGWPVQNPVAKNAVSSPSLKSLSIQPSNGLATVVVGGVTDCMTTSEPACYSLAVQLLATFTGIASITSVVACSPDGTCSGPVFPKDLHAYGLGSSRPLAGQPVAYYLDPSHQVASLTGGKGQADKMGPSTSQYGQLAVSPSADGQNPPAAVTNMAGTTLSLGYPGTNAVPVQHYSGTSIGNLSWDDFGTLWFTDTAADGSTQVYRMNTAATPPTVQPVTITGVDPGTIRGLSIAPDGQRLALITQTGSYYSVGVGLVTQKDGKWQAGGSVSQIASNWATVSQVAWRNGTVLGVLGSPLSSEADTIWELHSDGSQVVNPVTQQVLDIGPPKNLVGFGWASDGTLLAATQPQSAAGGATPPATPASGAGSTGSGGNILSFSATSLVWTSLVPGTLGNLPAASP
jgi:Lipoprotein LpqB beta-propeller domain